MLSQSLRACVRTYLDAALVAVDLFARRRTLRLAEHDHLLEQEDVTHRFASTVPDEELVLTQQHALLIQVHLKHTVYASVHVDVSPSPRDVTKVYHDDTDSKEQSAYV